MAEHCDTMLIEKCACYANDAYTNSLDGTFIEDKKTDCQAFVVLKDNEIIITGQGTTTMKDWMIDFQIWRRRIWYLDNTLVHSGFIKQYESVREQIHAEIMKHLSTNTITKIICTGHSLFGAISTIIALDCAIKYSVQVSCVTFGSPRVGSSKFSKLFNKLVATSFRCVRHKDPIVFTPLPGRFKHVRGGVHFGKKLTFKMPFYNPIGCKVSDHSMEDYLHFISGVNEEKRIDIFEPRYYYGGGINSNISLDIVESVNEEVIPEELD
jgi:predicted lipase